MYSMPEDLYVDLITAKTTCLAIVESDGFNLCVSYEKSSPEQVNLLPNVFYPV